MPVISRGWSFQYQYIKRVLLWSDKKIFFQILVILAIINNFVRDMPGQVMLFKEAYS